MILKWLPHLGLCARTSALALSEMRGWRNTAEVGILLRVGNLELDESRKSRTR